MTKPSPYLDAKRAVRDGVAVEAVDDATGWCCAGSGVEALAA